MVLRPMQLWIGMAGNTELGGMISGVDFELAGTGYRSAKRGVDFQIVVRSQIIENFRIPRPVSLIR